MTRPDARVSEALSGELLGAPITIHRAPGLAQERLEGILVDESLGTFVVRPNGGGPELRISKTGLEATVRLAAGEIPLKGDDLRVRPEDRTKRLAPRGRRW
jgi:RNase P/RNase MRP subunit p29